MKTVAAVRGMVGALAVSLSMGLSSFDALAQGAPPAVKQTPAPEAKAKPRKKVEPVVEAGVAESAESAESVLAVEAFEAAKPVEKKARAVRAKKTDSAGAAESSDTLVREDVKTTKSATVAPGVSPAPASAIDAFAAFLAKDGLNPEYQNESEAEDSESAKPAKKPRASKTAGRGKKT